MKLSVAESLFPGIDFDFESVLVPPGILKAMKTAKYDSVLTFDNDLVTLTDSYGSSVSESVCKTKFPDISSHLPSALDLAAVKPSNSFVRVNLDLLAQVAKLRVPSDHKTDNPVFDLYTQDSGDSTKPKPMVLSRAAKTLLVVVQPMYIK